MHLQGWRVLYGVIIMYEWKASNHWRLRFCHFYDHWVLILVAALSMYLWSSPLPVNFCILNITFVVCLLSCGSQIQVNSQIVISKYQDVEATLCVLHEPKLTMTQPMQARQ